MLKDHMTFSYSTGTRKVRGIEFSHKQKDCSNWADLMGQWKKKSLFFGLYCLSPLCSKYQLHSLGPRLSQPFALPNLEKLPRCTILFFSQGQTPLKTSQKNMLCWELKEIQRKPQTAAKWMTKFLSWTRESVLLISSLSCLKYLTLYITFIFLHSLLCLILPYGLVPLSSTSLDTQLWFLGRLWAWGGKRGPLAFSSTLQTRHFCV